MMGHVLLYPEHNPKFMICEIGFVFNPKYHGKGYATEACKALLTYGFEKLNAHRIIATCDPENTRSWKLMQRLGMRREAHLRKCLYLRTPEPGKEIDWRDEYHYAILKEEFEKPDQRMRNGLGGELKFGSGWGVQRKTSGYRTSFPAKGKLIFLLLKPTPRPCL
jgi:hypothetical protein